MPANLNRETNQEIEESNGLRIRRQGHLSILQTSRQIHGEISQMLYEERTFHVAINLGGCYPPRLAPLPLKKLRSLHIEIKPAKGYWQISRSYCQLKTTVWRCKDNELFRNLNLRYLKVSFCETGGDMWTAS